MNEKVLEFIEELKSWRQENQDNRSFIVVVYEKGNFITISCEGDSSAMSAGILSSTIEEKVSTEEVDILMTTVDKISFVLDNMNDFFNWAKNQHEEAS